ncbi:MAG: NAD-dependent epimerase/dehydratase family protein [Candidatus Omnitrophica bacterium]|nr:NAD-dependent epimerase/dehydratase family protein [Candidatus Omnitrophota bacterium]
MKFKNHFKNKNILVIGGTGTIGAGLTETLLREAKPKVLRVLSNDENALFQMKYRLRAYENIRYLIGDVRDKSRMRWAVRAVDTVFHSAALKHVALSEYNPFDAVETNVLGTQNVIEACLTERVKKMVFISTDKAVCPTSTMGATKLLAERLVRDASAYRGAAPTQFCCVRFGNVLGSRGSLVPLISRQVRDGGPVTITDSRATRFFMSVDEAVRLVLNAAADSKGGEIYILKMPSIRIRELMEVVIEHFAPKFGYSADEIRIEEIGLRKGEKLHEELMTEEESFAARQINGMFKIKTPRPDKKQQEYSSEKNRFLNKREIKKLLVQASVLEKE